MSGTSAAWQGGIWYKSTDFAERTRLCINLLACEPFTIPNTHSSGAQRPKKKQKKLKKQHGAAEEDQGSARSCSSLGADSGAFTEDLVLPPRGLDNPDAAAGGSTLDCFGDVARTLPLAHEVCLLFRYSHC